MRLIDADKLKAIIIEGYREEFFGSVLWDILNDIPTAFDLNEFESQISKREYNLALDDFMTKIENHPNVYCGIDVNEIDIRTIKEIKEELEQLKGE